MVYIGTLILFFLMLLGIGFSLIYFFKFKQSLSEKIIISLGIGLSVYPFIAVLLSYLRVPLDWRILLALSLIVPIYVYITNFNSINSKISSLSFDNFKLTRSQLFLILVLIIFSISLFLYVKGSFVYPWLEDTDPYSHAESSTFVSVEKTVLVPEANYFQYLDPYPPGFDSLMGVLHQTNDSIVWTLKFFNALICALSILFFYFFASKFMKSEVKAFFATLVLAAVPSYLSHFIWAHSLAMAAFMISLYCIESLREDRNWFFVLSLVFAGILLIQPTKPIKFAGMFLIYIIVKLVVELLNKDNSKEDSTKDSNLSFIERFKSSSTLYVIYSGIIGIVLSLIWWVTRWRFMLGHGSGTSVGEATSRSLWEMIKKAFPPSSGTATRPYTFNDFFWGNSQNMINNPVGWGWFISLLLFFSIVIVIWKYRSSLLKEENNWLLITLLWFIYCFLAVNTMTFNLPVGLFAFRYWKILAIPVAILCAQFIFIGYNSIKNKVYSVVYVCFIIFLLYISAFTFKYDINTSMWGPALYMPPDNPGEEATFFVKLPDLIARESRVFSPSDNLQISSDMFICSWCKDEQEFTKMFWNSSSSDISSFMKSHNYDYLLISQRHFYLAIKDNLITAENINIFLNKLSQDPSFKIVSKSQSSVLYKLN